MAAAISAGTLRTFDGPLTIDWAADSILVVGGSIDADAPEGEPQTADWDWHTLGVSGTAAQVDQPIIVPMAIGTRDGSVSMRTVRRTALTLYAAAAAFIRGTTLGIPQVMWCIPQTTRIRQIPSSSGSDCIIDFAAMIKTII